MVGFKFDHLHHVALDPAAAVAFYTSILGAVVVRPNKEESAGTLLMVGGVQFFVLGDEALHAAATADRTPRGLDHVAFAVEGLDELCVALERKGAILAQKPSTPEPGVRTARIAGPDGIQIELIERWRV